jgi:phasin family protein
MMQKHDIKRQDTVGKAFKAGQDTAESTGAAGKETGERVFKAGIEAATRGYDQAAAASREQLEKIFPQAAGTFDAMTGFQRSNLEAFAAAGTIAAKGVEALSGELLAFNKKAVEDSAANAKRLFECKTINELFEVQADLARAGFEQMIAQGTRFTELAVKVANEIAAPLQERVGEAVGKLAKPLSP